MSSILEKLWANMASYPTELSAEIKEREKFKEQFQAVCAEQPISFSSLDGILSSYLSRRTAVAQHWKRTLQVLLRMHFLNSLLFYVTVSRIASNTKHNEMLLKET